MILRRLRPEARPRAMQLFFAFSMVFFATSTLGEHLLGLLNHPQWVDIAVTLMQGMSAGLLIPAALLYLYDHKKDLVER